MKTQEFAGTSGQMRKDSPWLASEDILDAGDVLAEIEAVYQHKDAQFDDGRTETVFALKFVGKQRQLVLNATNRKKLVALFGTSKVGEWKGKKIVLYVDHNVRKPGGRRDEKTCGIRIKEYRGPVSGGVSVGSAARAAQQEQPDSAGAVAA